jgi:hypothetical protein
MSRRPETRFSEKTGFLDVGLLYITHCQVQKPITNNVASHVMTVVILVLRLRT